MPTIQLIRVNVRVDVASKEVDKLIKEVVAHHDVQPNLESFHYGWHVEDSTMLTMLFKWKNSGGQPDLITTHLNSVLDSPPEVMHVDFEPPQGFADAIAAPVTEVAIFLHEGGPPIEAQQNVEKAAKAFIAAGAELHGVAYGSTRETVSKMGIVGKSAVLLGGWESIEKHMEVRTSQVFKENVHLIANGTPRPPTVCHVHFKSVR